MNVLITGATGFIGKHLTASLSSSHPVRCLVRKKSDISGLRNSGVSFIYGDLLHTDSLLPALEDIDLVYHLAGEVHSRHRRDYYEGNILATKNLLEASNKKGVKKIIYLSSVGVYKPVKTKTLLTEVSECDPITFYGKTKLHAEHLIRKNDIPWIIVRAPVVYGPHQPEVVNRFFRNAIQKRIYIVGDGDHLRSLCYIGNLVEGLRLLLDQTNLHGEIYLLSDEVAYTFNEMIAKVSEVIKENIRIVFLPKILGDISWKVYQCMALCFSLILIELYSIKTMQLHLGCDIKKARTEIGYHPSVDLELGLKKTIEWIKQ